MSSQKGSIRRHKFHGDPNRFRVLADFIAGKFLGKINRIADVGGGQGMLCRILKKKYNFDCEVIDPRGFTLVGVAGRKEGYKAEMADFYDLIIGLHPDQALEEVVLSSLIRPTILIPCCNFWSKEEILGRDALIEKISLFYQKQNIQFEKIAFNFSGPKNIGLITTPPQF